MGGKKIRRFLPDGKFERHVNIKKGACKSKTV